MMVYLVSGVLAMALVLLAQCGVVTSVSQASGGASQASVDGAPAWRTWLHAHAADLLWLGAFLALWLPAAVRVDLGVDYSRFQGYRELFVIYRSGGQVSEGMDLGFVALLRLLGALTDDPQWLFAVTSALVVGLTLRAARRVSDEPALAVALFLVAGLYLESLNIVRQWIAIACVLNGFAWVAGDGPRGRCSLPRYAAWVVAGAAFHETCLLWLAVWPAMALLRDRMDARRALLLLVGLVGALLVACELAPVLLSGTRFGRYLTPSAGEYARPDAHIDTIVTSVAMFGVCLWVRRGESRFGEWDACLTACQVAGVALALGGLFLPSIADRLVRYFVPLLVLQLPRALAFVRNRDRRDALVFLALGCWVLVTFFRVYAGGQYGVLPYRCIFF